MKRVAIVVVACASLSGCGALNWLILPSTINCVCCDGSGTKTYWGEKTPESCPGCFGKGKIPFDPAEDERSVARYKSWLERKGESARLKSGREMKQMEREFEERRRLTKEYCELIEEHDGLRKRHDALRAGVIDDAAFAEMVKLKRRGREIELRLKELDVQLELRDSTQDKTK